MVDATNGKEAAEAVVRSQRRLEQAKAREPQALGIVARLRNHLEYNHFSDRLDEAFGREHRQT